MLIPELLLAIGAIYFLWIAWSELKSSQKVMVTTFGVIAACIAVARCKYYHATLVAAATQCLNLWSMTIIFLVVPRIKLLHKQK
jgi:hypothetical protein